MFVGFLNCLSDVLLIRDNLVTKLGQNMFGLLV